MQYFVINKSKKYNFLHSFTSITEIFHEKNLVHNSLKLKVSHRPNNADFGYFTDKTIIKTFTKFHFVMNFLPVLTHI